MASPELPDLPDLHDAILRSIEIDWETGRARCTLDEWVGRPTVDPDAEMRPVMVTLSKLTGAVVSRAEPWGPSIYVNSGGLSRGDSTAELFMEMQSGDEIVLRAATAEVTFER
jgi:hypothetical protein